MECGLRLAAKVMASGSHAPNLCSLTPYPPTPNTISLPEQNHVSHSHMGDASPGSSFVSGGALMMMLQEEFSEKRPPHFPDFCWEWSCIPDCCSCSCSRRSK